MAQTTWPSNGQDAIKITEYGREQLLAMPHEELVELFLGNQSLLFEIIRQSSDQAHQLEELYRNREKLLKDIAQMRLQLSKSQKGTVIIGNSSGGTPPGGTTSGGTPPVVVPPGGTTTGGTPPAVTPPGGKTTGGSASSGLPPVDQMTAEQKKLLEEIDAAKTQLKDLRKQVEKEFPKAKDDKGKPVRTPGCQDAFLNQLPQKYEDITLTEEELRARFGDVTPKIIGYTTSRDLVFVPAQLYVVNHRCAKYAAKVDGEIKFAQASYADQKLFPGSIVTSPLLAHFLVEKYYSGSPIYRTLNAPEFMNVNLYRDRVYRWVGRAAFLCAPLVYRASELILARGFCQFDESYGKFPGPHGYRTGYYWQMHTGAFDPEPPLVAIMFAPHRSESVLEAILGWRGGDWKTGILADGFVVYDKAKRLHPDRITERSTCWFHAREGIVTALLEIPNLKDLTDEQKEEIPEYVIFTAMANIFHVDASVRNATPEERLRVRQESEKPIVDSIFQLVRAYINMGCLDKGSKTYEALYYLYNNEERLRVFLDDPAVPLANALCEQEFIWLAIGRNNWKKSASYDGGMVNAVMYSIASLARVNDVNPFTYFQYLLDTLPALLEEHGMPDGCHYDTFMDLFAMEHLLKGADSHLPEAEREKLRNEASDPVKAKERMDAQFAKAHVPTDLRFLDVEFPFSESYAAYAREKERVIPAEEGEVQIA